jgi:hypothetical protein
MYNSMIQYIKDTLTTYKLDTKRASIIQTSGEITGEAEAYGYSINRPYLAFNYNFDIVIFEAINKGQRKDTDFRDKVDNFILSNEIGLAAATKNIVTIDGLETIITLNSYENGWSEDDYICRITLQMTVLKHMGA